MIRAGSPTDLCVCGHNRQAHERALQGTNGFCADYTKCGCSRFQQSLRDADKAFCVCGHTFVEHTRPAEPLRDVGCTRPRKECGCTRYQRSMLQEAVAASATPPVLVRLADYGRVFCSICHHAGLVRRSGPSEIGKLGIVKQDNKPALPKDWTVMQDEQHRTKLVCSNECAKALMMGPTPPRPRRGA